jgi:peptidoglycan/LPS O-acetylase OafA/YrhL
MTDHELSLSKGGEGALPPRPRGVDGYVPSLDGWRAIAVLGVAVYHFTVWISELRGTWLWQILRFGQYGVDIFFAISGFLITSRLIDEDKAAGAVSLRGFYIRRAFRILPAAFVFLTVVAVWTVVDGSRPTRPIEWLASALFFRNYVQASTITEHLWSLSVEEHFYALWPMLFVLLTRRKAYGWVLVGPLAVIVWRGLLFSHAVPDPFDANPIFRTDVRLDALLWGATAALALREPRVREFLAARLGPVAWLLAVGTFVAGEFMSYELGTTLQAVSAPLILLGTVLRPGSLRARILETSVLRWVGRLSYGFYLFQQIFVPWVSGIPFGWAYILPLTCASYYGIERPLMQLGRDLAARRRTSGFAARAALAVSVAAVGTGAVIFGFQHARLRGAHVVVCEDRDFRGTCVELGAGPHDLAAPGSPFPNDTMSSLRVGEGATARLCTDVEDGQGRGDCWELPPGAFAQTMGDKNDTVSFIEVVPRP